MNRPIFRRLAVEAIILLVSLAVFLFQLDLLPLSWRQSQADLASPSAVTPNPADYSLGMIAPNLDNSTVDQLYNNLDLNFIRLSGIYPLPVNANQPTPRPDSSFPKGDAKVKQISQKQQPIVLTLSPYKDGEDFDLSQCTGNEENLSCNFDTLNLIPEIIKRLDDNCDHNEDGDCLDTVLGAKESDGPIGRVKYFQIFNEPPANIPYFKGEQGPSYFAALVKEFINKIESNCSDCQIGLAGLAGFRDDNQGSFSENLLKRKQYFEQTLEILGNGRDKLDFFDFHYHALNSLNNYYEYAREKTIYETFHQALTNQGLSQVPIWMTEISAYTDSPYIPWDKTKTFPAKSEAEHAQGLLRKIIYAYGLGFKKVFHSPIQDRNTWQGEGDANNPCNNYFCHVGLVKLDDQPKIAYTGFKLISQELFQKNPTNVSLVQDDRIKIIKFTYQNQPEISVAWNDSQTQDVDLTSSFTTNGLSSINLITSSQLNQSNKVVSLGESPLILKAYSPPSDDGAAADDENDTNDDEDSSTDQNETANSSSLLSPLTQEKKSTPPSRINNSDSAIKMNLGTPLEAKEIQEIKKLNNVELKLKVAKGAFLGEVNFSWNKFSQADHNRFLRDNAEIAKIKVNNYTDLLEPGRWFDYQVIAYDSQDQLVAKSQIINLLLAGEVEIKSAKITEIANDRVKMDIQTNVPSIIQVDYQKQSFWLWLKTAIVKVFKRSYQPEINLTEYYTSQSQEKEHTIELKDLKPKSTYYYQIQAINANNRKNIYRSDLENFRAAK